MELVGSVNYLAVFVCAVLATGLGFTWYSPFLLGKMWLDSIDKNEEEIRRSNNPYKVYGLAFLGHFIMAYGLARVMMLTNSTTVTEGIRLAFLCWFGFTMATMMINTLFEGKSLRLVLVDGGYHLIVFLMFGIVLGAWS